MQLDRGGAEVADQSLEDCSCRSGLSFGGLVAGRCRARRDSRGGRDGQIDSRPQNFGEVQKRWMSGLTPKDGKSTTGCPSIFRADQQIGGDLV
jgi:hypothetical protein